MKQIFMMKTRILSCGMITAVMAAALCGCKTSEKNYRDAYEVARQAQYTGVDSTVYAKIRQEAVPSTVISNGDSIRIKTEFVAITKNKDGSAPASMPRYGVVVGSFKQVFNARAMLSRIASNGYPQAYIVETREPLYYVVATGASDIEEASRALKRVEADSSLRLRAPHPWILQSASHNR